MRLLSAGLLALVLVAACSEPPPPSNDPPRACKLDADCGAGRYCTVAGVCRRDCTTDAHCFGPTTSAQCNAQGKCIETVDAASPPPEPETGPEDSGEPDAIEEEGGA